MKPQKSREEQLTEWMRSKLDIEISIELLDEALIHPSYKAIDKNSQDNQRLEVIGDAVLDLLTIDWFYDRLDGNEGVLTRARAQAVSNRSLAKVGKFLVPFADLLRVAPAYEIHDKDLAAAVESLFGACFKNSGLKACKKLFHRYFTDQLEAILVEEKQKLRYNTTIVKSAVNILQEHFQRQQLSVPESKIEIIGGPNHKRVFRAVYTIQFGGNKIQGTGTGKTKKKAREEAAKDICRQLGIKLPKNAEK